MPHNYLFTFSLGSNKWIIWRRENYCLSVWKLLCYWFLDSIGQKNNKSFTTNHFAICYICYGILHQFFDATRWRWAGWIIGHYVPCSCYWIHVSCEHFSKSKCFDCYGSMACKLSGLCIFGSGWVWIYATLGDEKIKGITVLGPLNLFFCKVFLFNVHWNQF